MRQKKKPVPPPITNHFDLWRCVTVWDWEGAETWEEVGAKLLVDYVGRFDSTDDMIAHIEQVNIDGLYRWARFECPINDMREFAHVEWFEGHWI